jgi:gliding motility-associated-like protein
MTIISFEIFNRFGERVFQTYHHYAEWDGTYLGSPCDVGTYYYYAKIICGNGGDHILELKGDVTLLR